MKILELSGRSIAAVCVSLALISGAAFFAPSLHSQSTNRAAQPTTGARGLVKNGNTGAPLEGMMVQLVSHKNAIRTTVFSDQDGHFIFPQLETGWYLLRIARPLEFKAYQKDSVWIEGSPQLDEIVLQRQYPGEFLPPTPEIMAQLTDSEWLFNLPGTAQEKKLFSNACGSGCHTWHQSLRNRFDEKGWALMVNRMMTYATRLLIEPRTSRNPNDSESGFGLNDEEQKIVLKFLQRVRGPNSEFPPMKAFPRPKGAATRVVITEYELPRFDVRPHDVAGDAEGNIWYTSNREPIIGKLNPRTGAVTEFKIPITPGKHTGQHWLDVGKDGKIVFTESWANNLGMLDPRSGEVTKLPGMGGNKGLAPDGFIWGTCGGADGAGVCKFDPKTAKSVEKYPLKKALSTYGNEVSADGRYFAGGDPWQRDFDGIVWMDLKTKEIYEVETPSQAGDPSRGGIDSEGNAWIGGRGGTLSMFDHKTHQVREFTPPTPYLTFYEAKPDKNGEVWAGAQRGARMVRFNPKTDRWIEYQYPEPISLDWRTWVDNSTDPVSAWYGEHSGYLVHIQPVDGAMAAASASTPTSAQHPSPNPPQGNLQRSAEILYFKRLAESGSDRGKEIYFFKCWVCHNAYTKAAGTPAPSLKDLYKRTKLMRGVPVNDETVTEEIKKGGPAMPGYQYSLSDQDISDLVSFFREGKCCWEDADEKDPPRNARYRAQ